MAEHELKYLEEIERYLDGEMTAEEIILFEQGLIDEPQLKQEYDVLNAVVKEVRESKKRELKALLNEVDKELDNNKPNNIEPNTYKTTPLFPTFLKYAIAASVLFMIGVSVFWLINQSGSNREKLVADYWQKDAGLPVMMGESDAVKFDNAMSDYKSGKYNEALNLFKQIPASDTVLYYSALCMSELKQDATNQFQIVADNQSSVFQDKAKYYLLLLNIKADKKTKASKLMNELLGNKNHPYYSSIEKLSNEAYFKD
jgi:hypothetical protein